MKSLDAELELLNTLLALHKVAADNPVAEKLVSQALTAVRKSVPVIVAASLRDAADDLRQEADDRENRYSKYNSNSLKWLWGPTWDDGAISGQRSAAELLDMTAEDAERFSIWKSDVTAANPADSSEPRTK